MSNQEMVQFITSTLLAAMTNGDPSARQSIKYLVILSSQLSVLEDDIDNSVSLHNMH